MSNLLHNLFDRLGYCEENGLLILKNHSKYYFKNYPHRISRVLKDVIKPYAIFNLENTSENTSHLKPFNNPLILFYDNPSEEEYEVIAKHSFNLGKAPVIFISNEKKGVCEIYHGYKFEEYTPSWLSKLDIDDNILSVSSLRSGKGWSLLYDKYFKNVKTVDKYLLSNITDVRRVLIAKDHENGGLSPDIANKLIGRIIFIRYLIDRNVEFKEQSILVGNKKKERQENFIKLLLDKEKTYLFFEYISNKFKGDLFPLESKIKEQKIKEKEFVNFNHLKVLNDLLSCSNIFFQGEKINNSYTIQPSLFNYYDFEIIPVELISNIYESFLGSSSNAKTENKGIELTKQREVKAYYTPPFIVDYILSQTVNKHLESNKKASCKVLDPSCGSGIFLVETLRQIVERELKNIIANNKITIPNERLWSLLQENIFGIDIDPNAIEITTFSLYITLLDYKQYPKEIEEFEFKALKGVNLFSGADFFDENHLFNKVFGNSIKLDFIIGNPPWGQVKNSKYKTYIKERVKDEVEMKFKPKIGNAEISQAFLIRVSDFLKSTKKTKFCFIVTGKNFYNTNADSVEWRKYFLTKFNLLQFFDLVGVQNKVAGGNKIFEAADQPAAICLYEHKSDLNKNNDIQHITARANKYFNYFKTIVIEKNDIKNVNQELLINNDWLWKTLLYGNALDFHLVKKLRENFVKPEIIKKNQFEIDGMKFDFHGGYKAKDSGVKVKKETSHLHKFDYIEVESSKDLQSFYLRSSKKFIDRLEEDLLLNRIDSDYKVAQIPDIKFLRGKRLLIKKGLESKKKYKAVSSVVSEDCVFSSTIASIVPHDGLVNEEVEHIFYALSAIYNSKFFTYYMLMTSSSFGAGRNRVNFNEFLSIPISIDESLVYISKKIHEDKKKSFSNLFSESNEGLLELYISKAFNLTKSDEALIDYAVNISIPVLRRVGRDRRSVESRIFNPINAYNEDYLKSYINVFNNHFRERFEMQGLNYCVDAYVDVDYIAIHFKTSSCDKEIVKFYYDSPLSEVVKKIGSLGLNNVSKDLYYQQDVRGFNEDSFYIIKPNEIKNWHLALAYSDLNEFIEALLKAELKTIAND